ncbi:MAG: response regulator [Smithellaceae bacterium]|jgi:PAS domain S-box-containing protein|nr:response regulator [Smithellaceae bacterium]MDD3258386.1 response regulator [Smithellaceae bacterium]MDD3849097.1 response regulator [Smithellaceae bacterium]
MAKQIFIVDDNPNNLYLLASILKSRGWSVREAGNGKDALDAIRVQPPDLIVSDILMPVMDGYALCRECKADPKLKSIPFVFYTATYTEPKDEDFALSLGADRFLLKPQEPEILTGILEEFLHEGKAAPPEASSPLGEDMEFFRRHNEALFRKLEKKMQDLEAANRELRMLEEIYRQSFEHVTDVIFTVDAGLRIISISPSVEKALGYKPREFIGRSIRDLGYLFAADSMETALEHIGLVLQGTALPATIYEFRARDGAAKFGEVSGSPITRDGKVAGLVAVARDITERRLAEQKLRENEKRYKLLTEKMTDIVWISDMNLKTLYVTPSVQSVLGFSQEERMHQAVEQQITPESLSRGLEAMAAELALEKQALGDPTRLATLLLEYYHKDGSTRWMETIISGLRDDQGVLTGLHGVSRDVTKRKKAEEEKQKLEERLHRAEKMEALGKLAGGVAHDLNNVLGVLSGYSELLLLELPEDHKARKNVEKILQSTEKGAVIIQDLLTLARRGVAVSDIVNLNRIVDGFLKTPFFEKIKNDHPRITFRAECDPRLLNIKGSAVHLEKALINLVSNAAEAIAEAGEIVIRTENRYVDRILISHEEVQEGDYVLLIVSDTGMGIPAEHREKIFEPFFTKKTMGWSGTGLGLPIVWGTVKDQNGYIDLQTKEGKGTTFILYFPVTREEAALPQQRKPLEDYRGGGERILVVDDIAEQREIASSLLMKLGYEVETASGGEEAVKFLQEKEVDLVLLDMIMSPGPDGLETYRKIRDIDPRQKTILVSGFSETERVLTAQRLGAGAYVKKPYVMETIGLAIRHELKR